MRGGVADHTDSRVRLRRVRCDPLDPVSTQIVRLLITQSPALSHCYQGRTRGANQARFRTLVIGFGLPTTGRALPTEVPITDAPEAHKLLDSDQPMGKVLLTI